MNLVFQQKVAEKESKLKQSEEELYARHREMKDALDKQRLELEDKKKRIESGRPLTPENAKASVSFLSFSFPAVFQTNSLFYRRRGTDSCARKVSCRAARDNIHLPFFYIISFFFIDFCLRFFIPSCFFFLIFVDSYDISLYAFLFDLIVVHSLFSCVTNSFRLTPNDTCFFYSFYCSYSGVFFCLVPRVGGFNDFTRLTNFFSGVIT